MSRDHGTRGGTEDFRVDWDRFGELVIEKWQKRLLEKDIYDTGNLYRSIVYGYRASNALGQIVGRGYTRGNGGDLVKFKGTGRGRERRTWYYRIFAHERHRLGELVAEQYGRAAASMIHTLETHRLTTRN